MTFPQKLSYENNSAFFSVYMHTYKDLKILEKFLFHVQ